MNLQVNEVTLHKWCNATRAYSMAAQASSAPAERWSGTTGDWSLPEKVYLKPGKRSKADVIAS